MHLRGELPSGLPQDVVDDILNSLLRNCAITGTTLRTLKNCELHTLSFVDCRVVLDEWLHPLATINNKELCRSYRTAVTEGIVSASTRVCPPQTKTIMLMDRGVSVNFEEDSDDIRSMDFEEVISDDDAQKSHDEFYATFESHHDAYAADSTSQKDDKSLNSNCSTSSFVSAASNHDLDLLYTIKSSSSIASNEGELQSKIETSRATWKHGKVEQFQQSKQQDGHKSQTTANSSQRLLHLLPKNRLPDHDKDRPPSMDETEISHSSSSSSVSSNDQRKVILDGDFRFFTQSRKSCAYGVVLEDRTNAQMSLSVPTSESWSSGPYLNGNVAVRVHGAAPLAKTLSQSSVIPLKSQSIGNVLHSTTVNVKILDFRGCQHITDQGLLHFANNNLSSLEVARFDNCHMLAGRSLSVLTKSPRLRTVSLINCRRLTDEGIIRLATPLSKTEASPIQTLILNGCRCLSDRSMSALSIMSNLSKLDLSQCDLLTDDGIDHLKHLTKLKSVSFGWCREISDKGVDSFTSHPGRNETLKHLGLGRCCRLTDVGVGYLSRLLQLEELDLNGCNVISSHVLGETLGKLKFLTALDVSYCPGIL